MKIMAKWHLSIFSIFGLHAVAGSRRLGNPIALRPCLGLRPLVLPMDLFVHEQSQKLSREIPGKRRAGLKSAFPNCCYRPDEFGGFLLTEANTLAHINYQNRRFGRLQEWRMTASCCSNPEIVLVKFNSHKYVDALRVEPLREWDALQSLRKRKDVQFAELDTVQQRNFAADDPAAQQPMAPSTHRKLPSVEFQPSARRLSESPSGHPLPDGSS